MNKTVRITEGALYCGIVFIFLMVNRWMGNSLEFIFYWFLSFPIILYGAKYGIRNNIVLCCAMMVMAMIFTSITTWFYLFSAQLVGLFYGYGIEKKWSNGRLIFISILFTLFAYIVTTILCANFFGYDLSEDIMMANMILELTNIQVVNFDQFVMKLIIGIALISSILQGITTHMVSNILLKRLQIEVHPMKNPVFIKSKKSYGWMMSIAFIGDFLGNRFLKNEIILNILLIFALIAFVMALYYGIMIVWYHALCRNQRIWMILIVAMAFISPINLLIVGYGIYNQFIDTRLKGRLL